MSQEASHDESNDRPQPDREHRGQDDPASSTSADGAAFHPDVVASVDGDDRPTSGREPTMADRRTQDAKGGGAATGEERAYSPLVLVIEDEAPVANSLADLLRARGCRVAVASDGRSGLAAFRARLPDAVFCDLLLPGRNGFRLVEDFREAAPHVPVVVMTGIYRSESYREDLAHARIFLGKPFEPAELEEALSLAAASRAATEAAGGDLTAPAARRAEPWIKTALLPLPKLLQLLHRDRRTGLLTHRAGERRTVFHLEDGQVRFVRCNEPSLRLVAILSQLGSIAPDDLDAAVVDLETRSEPARLGDVLLERGLLGPAELSRALQLQLRRIIAGAFDADGGETLFREEVAETGEDVVLDADVRALVIAGCSAWRDAETSLLGHLPDAACPIVLAADPADPALKLPALLRQLAAAVREPTPLGDVVAMAELVGLRGRATVFGLLCGGVLKVETAATWDWHEPARVDACTHLPEDALPLAALLDLEDRRATGVLRVRLGDCVASLGLRDGAICSASSSDERSRLGQRLLDAGRITPEELEMALAAQRERRAQPVGRVLVELGVLDPTGLLQAVRAHVLAISREVAMAPAWDAATFSEGRLPETEAVPLGVSTSDVVLEALRGLPVRTLERLAGRLAADRPRLSAEALGGSRCSLTDTEELVRSSLTADTAALLSAVARADRSDPEVLRVACLALLLTPPEPEAAAAEGDEACAEDEAPAEEPVAPA